MPHVSSKHLNKKSFRTLMRQFYATLEEADSRSKVDLMLRELLTKTEKIMFAKRVALLYLLSRDLPFEKIEKILHLSPTTISKFSLGIETGKYKQTLMIVRRKGKILEILEKILSFGLPPKYGRGRWQRINHMANSKIDKVR